MVKYKVQYTALYERLSRDDKLQGKSNSISNRYLNEIPLSAMIWLITGFSVVNRFFLLCWQQDGQNHFDTDDLDVLLCGPLLLQ